MFNRITVMVALTSLLAASVADAAIAPADTVGVHRDSEVVVTASRYDESVHLSHANLTREDLAARIGTADIPLLLEDTPGLHAWSDAGNGMGYTYLNIRGFDQKRVGVMIDGIPLNDPEDHQVYWVNLPDFAASVEDIQVQRGITNSLGATTAIGGTVNLVTDLFTPEPELRVTAPGSRPSPIRPACSMTASSRPCACRACRATATATAAAPTCGACSGAGVT